MFFTRKGTNDAVFNERLFEQQKVVSYEYEINDYYGNEQSKRETIDGETTKGEYKTRMPDGKLQVVTYDSGPYGHLANVQYEDKAASYSVTHAPTASTSYTSPVAHHAPITSAYPDEDSYEDVV